MACQPTRAGRLPRPLGLGASIADAARDRLRSELLTTSPCVGGISKTDFDGTLQALAGCLG